MYVMVAEIVKTGPMRTKVFVVARPSLRLRNQLPQVLMFLTPMELAQAMISCAHPFQIAQATLLKEMLANVSRK